MGVHENLSARSRLTASASLSMPGGGPVWIPTSLESTLKEFRLFSIDLYMERPFCFSDCPKFNLGPPIVLTSFQE